MNPITMSAEDEMALRRMVRACPADWARALGILDWFVGTGMPAERSRHETAGMARPGESARSYSDPVALADAELASLRAAQQRIADHTDGRAGARAEPGQYPASTRPESAPSTSFHPGRGTHPKGSHARTHLSSTAPAGVPSASEVKP